MSLSSFTENDARNLLRDYEAKYGIVSSGAHVNYHGIGIFRKFFPLFSSRGENTPREYTLSFSGVTHTIRLIPNHESEGDSDQRRVSA